MSEFQYEQSALQQYLTQVIGQQMERHPELVQHLLQFKYNSVEEFLYVLQHAVSQQTARPPSQFSEKSVGADSMEITDYIADSEDEDDPLEFRTSEEAQQYAWKLSFELLDEIIAEVIAEIIDEAAETPGVLDLDEQTRREWCESLVLRDVWEAMTI